MTYCKSLKMVALAICRIGCLLLGSSFCKETNVDVLFFSQCRSNFGELHPFVPGDLLDREGNFHCHVVPLEGIDQPKHGSWKGCVQAARQIASGPHKVPLSWLGVPPRHL